jgi:microcin C transport system permease protein
VIGLIQLVIVLVAMFFLTTRLIPAAVVRLGRALGFPMTLLPSTKKRLDRFKRIKRGYYSFLAITTLFVASLFLELLVNDKALVIHYQDRTAFPAVAQWLDTGVFFADISHFNKKVEFGQVGKGAVNYRAFAAACDDPSTLKAELDALKTELAEKTEKLGAPPGEGARKGKVLRYKRKAKKLDKLKGRVATLETAHGVFASGDAWSIMPIYPYSPYEVRLDLKDTPPNKPFTEGVPLGTDESGRDVLALLVYGFRISLAFALIVAFIGYCVGIVVGSIQGYYGGWVDIITQRFQEIWGSIPFLLTIMIIAASLRNGPTFFVLVGLLVALRSWLGITFYIRGEFYREKSKDYVQAAIGAGVADWKIMLQHILPNALVPVVTYAPFAIVAYIGSLVSLDYLGFGLPTGTPSWGALLRQGLERVKFDPHLVIVPISALCVTLYSVVMIGEAVREAFDPKVFSRLR